ncbi:MAG: hypothetical protein HFE78_04925 [Clostridiales bacterium]|nr:hypothetical protein [Clostridiales bacterium]
MFRIRVDSSKCTSLIEGAAYLNNNVYDYWRYSDLSFESGKAYGIISEYQQGCMYLSYLMGGKIDFDNLQIYIDEEKITKEILYSMSWNLEPLHEKFKNKTVKKSIEKMLKESICEDSFDNIAEKFILTEPRYDRRFSQLSGERWRASAALGYAAGKKIFYAPYESSEFYYHMSHQGFVKVLRNLTNSGAMVFLPAGSDIFIKHIVDECIYISREYNIDSLKQFYTNMLGKGDWIR